MNRYLFLTNWILIQTQIDRIIEQFIGTGGLKHELNSWRPMLNGRHFADDIFNCISLIENNWSPIKISLKFVPGGPIDNIPALVRIMVWRRPGGKPLSELMMDSLPTHICVIRPKWVKLFYGTPGQVVRRFSANVHFWFQYPRSNACSHK